MNAKDAKRLNNRIFCAHQAHSSFVSLAPVAFISFKIEKNILFLPSFLRLKTGIHAIHCTHL
jgi:hypothetical protein